MGEVFDQYAKQGWGNFWCNDQYGGKKILKALKTLYVEGGLSNRISNEL